MSKITRVRTGCWTCKKRKCDEQKPHCNNCLKTKRKCEGYGIRLCFDVDDSRNNDRFDQKGNLKHSFIGRPRITKNKKDKPPNQITGEIVDSQVTPVLSNTEGKSYLQIENPIHILQAQSLSLTSQYEESPQLSVERILPTPMEQQNVHQPQNARIIDEVINASNVQMETLPKFDSVAYPYSKIAGANFEAFGSELFEGLEYLLKSPSIPTSFGTPRGRQHQDGPSQEPNSNKSNYHHIPDTQPAFEVNSNFTHAQERENFENPTRPDRFAVTHSGTQVFDRNYPVNVPALAEDSSLSYEEENMMLKHFFKNLLPLLDAHPNSPWPDLALKYCDFDIARSCFISLACIHIYESRKGGNEYYKKGMLHINNTMDYLIQFISSNSDNSESKIAKVEQLQSNGILNDSVVAASTKKKLISSFVILVLINVHILFAVLEKGLSSFSRFFFKVFASVCQDEMFYSTLLENDKKQSLVVVLSWYDTVSAIVSPDFRLPYCSPDWYGSSFGESDKVSTAKMMGCPGEIFKEMAKVCLLRHELHKGLKVNREDILREYEVIKSNLLRYREYVIFETPPEDYDVLMKNEGQQYSIRLKAAQCWALAVYTTLVKTVEPPQYDATIKSILHEFIDIYGSMKSSLPFVTQMVWPVFAMGCECTSAWEKSKLEFFMDTLYHNAQMGTLFTLKQIVTRVWETGESSEDVIKTYLDEGIDYLPL